MAYDSLLFRVAFPRARYGYGCIGLTTEERAYERPVFGLARAWANIQNAATTGTPPHRPLG